MLTMPTTPLRMAEGLSRAFLLHHRVCPKAFDADGTLIVAAAEDAIVDAVDEIGLAYGCATVVETVPVDVVERMIERLAAHSDRSIELARAEAELDDLTADVRDLANQPPVIRYVNLVVRDAYDAGEPPWVCRRLGYLSAARSG